MIPFLDEQSLCDVDDVGGNVVDFGGTVGHDGVDHRHHQISSPQQGSYEVYLIKTSALVACPFYFRNKWEFLFLVVQ
eukprot:m.35884 g.35884  ORF g.35884 m.35884 type:complete len:77 (-) comp6631_c0_seq2:9-239(-)